MLSTSLIKFSTTWGCHFLKTLELKFVKCVECISYFTIASNYKRLKPDEENIVSNEVNNVEKKCS